MENKNNNITTILVKNNEYGTALLQDNFCARPRHIPHTFQMRLTRVLDAFHSCSGMAVVLGLLQFYHKVLR